MIAEKNAEPINETSADLETISFLLESHDFEYDNICSLLLQNIVLVSIHRVTPFLFPLENEPSMARSLAYPGATRYKRKESPSVLKPKQLVTDFARRLSTAISQSLIAYFPV